MKEKIKIYIYCLLAFWFYTFCLNAETVDPFANSFTYIPSNVEVSGSSSSQESESGIPTQRYNLNKYFVKGIIRAGESSMVIVSWFPGGRDEVLRINQPLGNESHVITKIMSDYIELTNNDNEKERIPVTNRAPSTSPGT